MNTKDGSAPGGRDGSEYDDDELTRQYLDLVRSLHRDWTELEAQGDDSVQLSRSTRAALSEAVRADARHGARVQMPPTDLGPYTLTELAVRTLIRDAVDSVSGALSLRSAVEYGPVSGMSGPSGWGTRGVPVRVTCRISAAAWCSDLHELAGFVRVAVAEACAWELDLPDVTIDIHIEDLYDY